MPKGRSADGLDDIAMMGNRGIFGNDGGLAELEKLSWEVGDDGVKFSCFCHNCGSAVGLIVEWPELVALKYGLTPSQAFQWSPGIVDSPISWAVNRKDKVWVPDLSCRVCDATHSLPIQIGFTEPESMLRAGRAASKINPAGEKKVSHICMQALQALQGHNR